MNVEKVREMIMIAVPVPDGQIPISARPQRDDLKALLIQLGFEFLVDNVDGIRKEIDPEEKGTIDIQKLAEWICTQLQGFLDEKMLTDAFNLFDADKDGKINLEEFEFFMNSFAKEMNSLRDNKIVKEMIETSKKHADAEQNFEITKLVAILRDIWK